MDIIYVNEKIVINWTINRNASEVQEDFSRADLRVFLTGNDFDGNYDGKYYFGNRVDANGRVVIEVPANTLTPGTYCIEGVWIKNDHELINSGWTRSISRARKDRIFKVAEESEDFSSSSSEGDPSVHEINIKTGVTSYGYDGMSAYETAVFEGSTVQSEKEWIEKYEEAEDRINYEMEEDTPGTWANAELLRKRAEGQLGSSDEGWSTSREHQEDVRQANEAIRQANEETRQEQEGSPTDAASSTGSRWARYKQAEIDRNTSYASEEGSAAGSTTTSNDRWGKYKAAEAGRDSEYASAEGTASASAGDANRWGSYKTAENTRDAARLTAEGTIDSESGASNRWGQYKAQEGTPASTEDDSRWAEYNSAEDDRDTAYATAEGAATDAASATGSRWARYNKAEADRNAAYAEEEGSLAGSSAGDSDRWGQFKSAEADRNDAMAPLVGYFGCATAASTAAKEVSASDYVLTSGGSIKVKFTYANSASSPTLNINSTGAKAIVYNGAVASATNTWAAGDVVEFYYDPTYNSNAGAFVGIPTVVSVSQNSLTIGGNYAGELSTTYDVTLHNSGATFASLEALLSDENLSTLIPTAVRKGGMSIKFVQSSDNKYVQYRYKESAITGSPNPFINVNNWEMSASTTDVINLDNIEKNEAKRIVQNSSVRRYSTSDFQEGYIYPSTGQNATLSYNHIRSESILIAKDDFYLQISNDIKGRIYYYSNFALNTFTESVELVSGFAYYIPVGTFYRLAFCYADNTTPDISDIIGNEVSQLIYTDADVVKLQTLTSSKFDVSLFQLGSISTSTGTNTNNQKRIRTEGLLTASENFFISLPDNMCGVIYYYSEYSYASYSSYSEMLPNSLTYVGKGTYYRLVFYYVGYENLPNPVVSELLNTVSITYNLVDRLERLDLNADGNLWYTREIALDTGEIVTTNKRILSRYIKKSEYSIYATGGYRVSIYVYNENTYLGCLNEGGVLSTTTIKWWRKIDLTELSNKNPQYKFTVVACRATSDGTPIEDVMTTAESENIKMLTPFEMELFINDTFCPLVSFIDDDVPEEALDNWYSLANDTGIRCGFAVPTAEPNATQWERIKRMQSDGFDFLSHTHNHINLMNETDPDVIKADLQASVDTFISNGIRANALVYPQSSISNLALGIVKQYFEYSFNGVDGIGSIQGNPLRQHNITRSNTIDPSLSDYTDPDSGITYQVHAMLPLSTLKSYIDKAVEENCWVIFETHFRNSRTTDPSTNDGFIYTPSMRQETIDLIKYAISKKCKVVTPAEGYQLLKNRFMMGVYGSNNYHIVDHNGFVYRRNM